MTLKNHKHFLLIAPVVLSALFVTSCNHDEVEPIENSSAMLFGSQLSATRALIESTEDLQTVGHFGVFGSKDKNELFTNQDVTYNSASTDTDTKWEYNPIKYWDQATTVVYDFSAYAPYKDSGVSSADNKFTVTGIPQWQECLTEAGKNAAYDFLVADNRLGNFKKGDFPNGVVKFDFKHKLAKVIVSITKENSATLKDITYTVKKVTIGGDGTKKVYGTGDEAITITADQNSKVPAEQSRTFVRDYLTVDSKGEKFDTPATYDNDGVILYDNSTGLTVPTAPTYQPIATYLVAPFELAAGNTMPVTVKYSTSNGGDKTPVESVTTLNGFKPGYVYNIKLKVGAVNVTAAVIEIQQWTDGGSADDEVYNW